jgi:hypothetical protein
MTPLVDYGVFVGKFTDAYGNYLTSREINIKSIDSGKVWTVMTYAAQDVPNDPNYSENAILGDLPAGKYEVTFLNNYQYHKYKFTIRPGAITYISFKSGEGFAAATPLPEEGSAFSTPSAH